MASVLSNPNVQNDSALSSSIHVDSSTVNTGFVNKAKPSKQGLYRPSNERDACGVGFVAHIKGKASSIKPNQVNKAYTDLLTSEMLVVLALWRILKAKRAMILCKKVWSYSPI